VLLVDFDPQGALSVGLGVNPHDLDRTIYNVLIERDVAVDDVLLKTNTPGMDLLPSNIDLSAAELQLVNEVAREQVLARALAPVLPDYDIVLIDCQPSLGLLTINALTAATEIIIPVQAEYYALEGLSQLVAIVRRIKEGLNPELAIRGVLITMFDGRTKLATEVVEEVHRYFPDRVFATQIPRNIRLSEAPSFGKPAILFDVKSRGAQAYLSLARELVA
jgi:chromosome partitioning protein